MGRRKLWTPICIADAHLDERSVDIPDGISGEISRQRSSAAGPASRARRLSKLCVSLAMMELWSRSSALESMGRLETKTSTIWGGPSVWVESAARSAVGAISISDGRLTDRGGADRPTAISVGSAREGAPTETLRSDE
jgi:hypothetical protein